MILDEFNIYFGADLKFNNKKIYRYNSKKELKKTKTDEKIITGAILNDNYGCNIDRIIFYA